METDREAVEAIVTQHSFEGDVAYGHTKLFVRTPRSLFTLEQERAALIPILVLFLQKVSTLMHTPLTVSRTHTHTHILTHTHTPVLTHTHTHTHTNPISPPF